MNSTAVSVKQSAKEMCELRDEIVGLITQSIEKLGEAEFLLKSISDKASFSFDRNVIFSPSNGGYRLNTIEKLTKQADRKIWDRIIELGEFRALMSVKEQRKIDKALENVPQVTYETVTATFSALLNSRGNMLHDLIETAFLERSSDYSSNKGNKINKRHIVDGVFDKYGYVNYGSYAVNRVEDITKAISILTGIEAPYPVNKLSDQDEIIEFNGAVKYKRFQKGTVHIQILDNTLLNKINNALADAMGAKIGCSA